MSSASPSSTDVAAPSSKTDRGLHESALWIMFAVVVLVSASAIIVAYVCHRKYQRVMEAQRASDEAMRAAKLSEPTKPPLGHFACESPGGVFALAVEDASTRAGQNYYVTRDLESGGVRKPT